MSNLRLRRFNQPSLELAQIAQPIGFAAWTDRLGSKRPENEIRHVFDPGNPMASEQLHKRMLSKVGKFAGAVVMDGTTEVAYAWAAEDVGNMGPLRQHLKIMVGGLFDRDPYVWLGQINVLPYYQGNGIGTAVLRKVLLQFEQTQKPTTYVFDENPQTLQWFQRRGFVPRPDAPTDPNERPDGPDMYFGEGAEHVQQWRLEGPSITEVAIYNPANRRAASVREDY